MRKILVSFLIVLGLAAPASAHELSDRMLQLFKDKSRNVSLGAMLIADPVSDNEELIKYARWSLKKNDPPLERAVKRYYLARATYENEDTLAFIRAFPEEPEAFKEVLAFDASLTRSVSGVMVLYLVDLTECHTARDVREAARDKVDRLRMVQLLSGWAAEIFPDQNFPLCPNR